MEPWGGGTGGPDLSTTLLCPKPYIVNFPLPTLKALHSGISTLTYHVFYRKYIEIEILS
jgi:hypothetical protein